MTAAPPVREGLSIGCDYVTAQQKQWYVGMILLFTLGSIIRALYTFSFFLLLNDIIVANRLQGTKRKCTDTKSNKLE